MDFAAENAEAGTDLAGGSNPLPPRILLKLREEEKEKEKKSSVVLRRSLTRTMNRRTQVENTRKTRS
jgi:hypothetical protein